MHMSQLYTHANKPILYSRIYDVLILYINSIFILYYILG